MANRAAGDATGELAERNTRMGRLLLVIAVLLGGGTLLYVSLFGGL
jgi:hypothetical protein